MTGTNDPCAYLANKQYHDPPSSTDTSHSTLATTQYSTNVMIWFHNLAWLKVMWIAWCGDVFLSRGSESWHHAVTETPFTGLALGEVTLRTETLNFRPRLRLKCWWSVQTSNS